MIHNLQALVQCGYVSMMTSLNWGVVIVVLVLAVTACVCYNYDKGR